MITLQKIKELRERTGVSLAECRKALQDAQGDWAEALKVLSAQAAATAQKKADRTLKAGVVASYLHNDRRLGALLELACETDFVARNQEFRALADDLAMQVAAFAPPDLKTLLDQPFLKNEQLTVREVIQSASQKFGERLEVTDFKRCGFSSV